jgi:uncharacterized protein (DUF885 family)
VSYGIPILSLARRPGYWWALFLVAGCAQGSSGAAPAPAPSDNRSVADSAVVARRIDAVADEYFAAWLHTFPLDALFSGVPEASNDKLNENSLAAVHLWQHREDSWLAQLRAIDVDRVRGAPQEVTYGVLRETLEASRQTRICRNELLPLSQQGGFQINFPVLAQLQPVGTPKLRTLALARWRAVAPYIDTEIATLREGVHQGYTQPRLNAREVLEQLDDILRLPPAQSPFAGLADRDSTPGFRYSVVAIVAREILPAVRRYRDFVASEYLSHARETTALSALPHGAECYRALVRRYTTMDLEPRALYQLGLKQMAAIEAEMRPVAERAFGTSDLPGLMQRLRTDSQYTFRSREELIRTAQHAVTRAKAAMPRWFGRLPREGLIVDPCLAFEEKSGCPNSYVSGTPDGSRPGRWRINASVVPPQPRAPLEGTAFHETIPGHHLQGAIAQERPGSTPITRYFGFTGYWEGWALYAEYLALEMGIYSSDLYRLGELGEQALRAARLVVDPGLSVLGCTRQQAIDYMMLHLPYSRSVVESEVDRYIAGPGQATAYMVGRLEIERLREKAGVRLGKGFDIREFHDQVLENGAVPLDLLRSHIEAWLQSRAQPTSGR